MESRHGHTQRLKNIGGHLRHKRCSAERRHDALQKRKTVVVIAVEKIRGNNGILVRQAFQHYRAIAQIGNGRLGVGDIIARQSALMVHQQTRGDGRIAGKAGMEGKRRHVVGHRRIQIQSVPIQQPHGGQRRERFRDAADAVYGVSIGRPAGNRIGQAKPRGPNHLVAVHQDQRQACGAGRLELIGDIGPQIPHCGAVVRGRRRQDGRRPKRQSNDCRPQPAGNSHLEIVRRVRSDFACGYYVLHGKLPF